MSDLETKISAAIGKHGAWKLRLRTALHSGAAELDADTIAACDLCEFGHWLYDPAQAQVLGETPAYRVIARLHAEFHEIAASVVRAAQAGDTRTAQTILEGEFADHSTHLVAGLSKWLREERRASAA